MDCSFGTTWHGNTHLQGSQSGFGLIGSLVAKALTYEAPQGFAYCHWSQAPILFRQSNQGSPCHELCNSIWSITASQ